MKTHPFTTTKITQFWALALQAGIMFTICATSMGAPRWPEPSRDFAPKQTYAVGYDKLWDKTIEALENNRITVVSADKASGIIQTDYVGVRSELILGGIGGASSNRYKYNLTLRNQSDGSVRLNIICKIENSINGSGGASQWIDVSERAAKYTKQVETWLYEQIEKGLPADAIVDSGNEVKLNTVLETVPVMQPLNNINDPETLTNGSIVKLVKAGLSEEVVLSVLKTKSAQLDLSIDALLALKSDGVSDSIINAMVLRGQGTSASAGSAEKAVKLNKPLEKVVSPMPASDTKNTVSNTTDPAVARFRALLKSNDPEEVVNALNKLRQLNAVEAVPDILPRLKDSNVSVLCGACRTLAVLANKDAIPSIEPLLNLPDDAVKSDESKFIRIFSVSSWVRASPVKVVKQEAQDAINTLRSKP